jgi:hypothetical protein
VRSPTTSPGKLIDAADAFASDFGDLRMDDIAKLTAIPRTTL